MKSLKQVCLFSLLQLFCIFWTIYSFRLIPNRDIASLVAGIGFLSIAIWMFLKIWRWPDRFLSPVFYVTAVFLFGITLPILGLKLTHLGQNFYSASLFGIVTGSDLHNWSLNVYYALMATTLVEWFKCWYSGRKKS